MQPAPASGLSRLLDKTAETLDISDSLYEEAVLRYEDVAEWLADDESPLAIHSSRVYPQGSFRLGTVVRPVNETDHYDIDLVCQLEISKQNTTQSDLKALVGDRLKDRADLKAMLDESRRCWNLDYAQNFHMDILPCLDNDERPPDGILLTDTDLVHWQKSNPIAYGNWFRERMRVVFDEKRAILAKALDADIESVPEWRVRTPLQRVVQILKRHRDIYFSNQQEHRPISILITTLAAHAYSNQMDTYESLIAVLDGMPRFIEHENGRYIVRNPVEPDENFADKWNEKPVLGQTFMAWLRRAQSDFKNALVGKTPDDAATLLAPILGTRTMAAVAKSLGIKAQDGAELVPVRVEPQVPALASVAHVEQPVWPERLTGKVWVHGGIYLSHHKGKKLWDLSTRAVPKRVGIKFTAKTNVREPYTVKWQVVNTGKEALERGQLRGDFYESTGRIRWEDTQYAGTHWVEAFIIKDGICVARSGPTYVRVRP